jgi:hypothetical protein
MSRLHLFLAGWCVLSFGGQAGPPLALTPVWRQMTAAGGEALEVGEQAGRRETDRATNLVVFRAVTGRAWPEGLVPVFGVQVNGRFELRRLPLAGQENFTDPLFFVLPLAEEPETTRIAGRWNCRSQGNQGSQHRLAFEFAVENGRVAGRFDQDTDYRFAFITGGTWQTNRVEFVVEYINDRYLVTGGWQGGHLAGAWRQQPEGDEGIWEATRPVSPAELPPADATVPLYEWRGSNGRRHYTTETKPGEPGWERTARPLGRVWPP